MLRPYNETSRDDTALVARMLCLWHDAERGRTPGRVYVRPTTPRALRGCAPRPHAKGVAAAATPLAWGRGAQPRSARGVVGRTYTRPGVRPRSASCHRQSIRATRAVSSRDVSL